MAGLIINADDLGYSTLINQAIIDLFTAGLVTSASLLVNQPASEAAVELARQRPQLSIGVHLNLSLGRPILAAKLIPTLVDEQGIFWDAATLFRRAVLGQVNWHEAAAELEAQVRWALARGLHLDNLDSHVHFHSLPAARRITSQLARQYHVSAWRTPYVLSAVMPTRLWSDVLATPVKPLRSDDMFTPDYLLTLDQWGERLLTDARIAKLLGKPDVVAELVLHPGYRNDPELPASEPLNSEQRQGEVNLVRNERFHTWLDDTGARLVSFANFQRIQT